MHEFQYSFMQTSAGPALILILRTLGKDGKLCVVKLTTKLETDLLEE